MDIKDVLDWLAAFLKPQVIDTLGGAAAVALVYLVHRLRKTGAEKVRLEDAIAENNAELDHRAKRIAELERYEANVARLPETILKTVDDAWRSNNQELANNTIREWLAREGEAISKIMTFHASWAAEHAAGDIRALGLVAAEARATAAVALWPPNLEAAVLRGRVKSYGDEEEQPIPPLTKAVADFDQLAHESFNADDVRVASAVEEEAIRRSNRGHDHLALPLAEWAIRLRLRTVGEKAVQTLFTQRLKAEILIGLGRYDEALSVARAVVETMENDATLASHPDVILSRLFVDRILRCLGRYNEALIEAQGVLKDFTEHPALGPSNINTLHCRALIVRILHDLGRYDEALIEAQGVVKDFTEHPALGPLHINTLTSRALVASILRCLGRYDEALIEAQGVVKNLTDEPAFGPLHPETLICRYYTAQILHDLGRYDEALIEAQGVVKDLTEHPALGPSHPNTLSGRALVATNLTDLGRYDEALIEAQDVVKDQTKHQGVGPSHANTLSSRFLVAQILVNLGRYDDALIEAQTVARARADTLGPSHPETLHSRDLVTQILRHLATAKESSAP